MASLSGQGTEAMVVQPACSSLVDPALIAFGNPDWAHKLTSLAKTAVGELLGSSQAVAIGARLSKLMLYRSGDHSPPQRITEREVGVFATLVVQLPSSCKGGELIVRHIGREMKYLHGEGDDRASYYCYYACHFADVEFEMLKVTSGYCAVLVYDLTWDDHSVPAPSGSAAESARDAFAATFTEWPASVSHAILTLENQYTEQGLAGHGLAALKGHDLVVANVLQAANAQVEPQHRMRFFVVQMALTENFEYEGSKKDNMEKEKYCGNWRLESESTRAVMWWNSTGHSLSALSTISLQLKGIVGKDEKKIWEVKDTNIDSGIRTKVITYQAWILVLLPEVTTFLGPHSAALTALDLANRAEALDVGEPAKTDIAALCAAVVQVCGYLDKNADTVLLLLRALRFHKAISSSVREVAYTALGKSLDAKRLLVSVSERAIEALLHSWLGNSPPSSVTIPLADSVFAILIQWSRDGLLTVASAVNIVELCLLRVNTPFDIEILPHVFAVIAASTAVVTESAELHAVICKLITAHSWPVLRQAVTVICAPMPIATLLTVANAFITAKHHTAALDILRLVPLSSVARADTGSLCTYLHALSFLGDFSVAEGLCDSAELLARPNLGVVIAHARKNWNVPLDPIASRLLIAMSTTKLGRLDAVIEKGEPQAPASDWRMPNASIPRHPDVEAFLRSPERERVFTTFTDSKHALNFAHKYDKPNGSERSFFHACANYSASFRSSRGSVTVTKTSADFENRLKEHRRIVEEASFLRVYLQTLLSLSLTSPSGVPPLPSPPLSPHLAVKSTGADRRPSTTEPDQKRTKAITVIEID